MSWLATFLLIVTCVVTVQSQVWVGNYTTDTSCASGTCCCPGPSMQITRPAETLIAFTTGLYGQCLGQTSYSSQMTYPSGFSASISISIITLTFTLSNDSNRITITNTMGASCGAIARRTTPLSTTGASTTGMSGTTAQPSVTTRPNHAGALQIDWLVYLSLIILFSIMQRKF